MSRFTIQTKRDSGALVDRTSRSGRAATAAFYASALFFVVSGCSRLSGSDADDAEPNSGSPMGGGASERPRAGDGGAVEDGLVESGGSSGTSGGGASSAVGGTASGGVSGGASGGGASSAVGGTASGGASSSSGGGQPAEENPSRWESRPPSTAEWLPGHERSTDLGVYSDGGFVEASSSSLQRYDDKGFFLWNYNVDGPSNNRRVAVDEQDNTYAAILDGPEEEVLLVKLSEAGEVVWTVPGIHFAALAFGPGEEIVTIGYNGVVQKRSPDGELVWEEELGEQIAVTPRGIVVAPDGLVTVVGSTQQSAAERNDSDGWIAQLTADGDLVFEKTFGSDTFDQFIGVVVNAEGEPVAVGTSNADLDGDGEDWEELLLVHFSNEGEPVSIIGFEKDNAEPPYDDLEHPYDMGVDAQGNIVVVSGYTPEGVTWDAIVLVVSPSGVIDSGVPLLAGGYIDSFILGVGQGGHQVITGFGSTEDNFLARFSPGL